MIAAMNLKTVFILGGGQSPTLKAGNAKIRTVRRYEKDNRTRCDRKNRTAES